MSGFEDPLFRLAVDMIDAGDAAELRALLKRHPKLVQQRLLFEGGNYFRSPTPLESWRRTRSGMGSCR